MSEGDGPKFACDACGREFKWKPELAGKKAKCKCGATVTVPQAPPAPAAVEDDPFDVADMPEPIPPRGGARASSAPPMAPPPLPMADPPQQIACPICNTPAAPTAVLCMNCGYNFRTGVRMPGAGRGQALAYATKGAHTGGGISADTYAQAAKAAWMAPLIAFTLGCCTRGAIRGAPAVGFVIAGFQLLLILGGLGLGIFALTGVRKHGSSGIMAPAIVGICLNVGIIALNVILVIMLTSGKLGPPTPVPGGGAAPPPRTVPIIPRSR